MKGMNLYEDMIADDRDWVYPDRENRSPDQYPYDFTAYFLWKGRGIDNAVPMQSDRMRMEDKDKFAEAISGVKNLMKVTKDQAHKVVEIYFGDHFECVGYAVDCNASSGNPIGIFFVLECERD